MLSRFSKNIAPFVTTEFALAGEARSRGNPEAEFKHLENAHVLGQGSTYWHVKAHVFMLGWAIRNNEVRELFGQLLRIIGAATKTVFGLVPEGNTGGANVSPFKVMPITPTHKTIITSAKTTPG